MSRPCSVMTSSRCRRSRASRSSARETGWVRSSAYSRHSVRERPLRLHRVAGCVEGTLPRAARSRLPSTLPRCRRIELRVLGGEEMPVATVVYTRRPRRRLHDSHDLDGAAPSRSSTCSTTSRHHTKSKYASGYGSSCITPVVQRDAARLGPPPVTASSCSLDVQRRRAQRRRPRHRSAAPSR